MENYSWNHWNTTIFNTNNPTCVSSDDMLIIDETEMADIFNNYFSSIAANLADNMNTKDKLKSSLMPLPNKTSFYFYPITFEMKRIISSIKSKSTSGSDDFHTKLLKFLPDSTLSVLTFYSSINRLWLCNIFQRSKYLKNSYLQKGWY